MKLLVCACAFMYAPRDLSAKVSIKTAMCVCSKERLHTVTIPQKSNMVPELGHAASTSPSTTQPHRSFSPPLNRHLLAHFASALLLHARPRAGCCVSRCLCPDPSSSVSCANMGWDSTREMQDNSWNRFLCCSSGTGGKRKEKGDLRGSSVAVLVLPW